MHPCVLLVALLVGLHAPPSAHCTLTRLAGTSSELAAELLAAEVPDVILLTDDVCMQQHDWPPAISTQLGKNVTIQGAAAHGTSITYPMLDWNWVTRVLRLAPGVWLTLRSIAIAGFQPTFNSDYAFLSYSPNARLELQDVIMYLPISLPNTLRIPAARALPPPASMPNFRQQVEEWPGCYGWSNSAGTYFCYNNSMRTVESYTEQQVSSASLWGRGGYVVHVINGTSTAPRLMSDECLSRNIQGLAQCYNEAVVASIPPPPMPPRPPALEPPFDETSDMVPMSIITPVVIFGLIAIILLGIGGWWWYRHRTHYLPAPLLSLRKYMEPLPGNDTTLVVTDIQGSTALWESLPSVIMDAAIKQHHTCIRQVLVKHCGTESATEGDSFILAFHTAELAVAFCLETQDQLMQVEWSRQLLQRDSTCPVWARPTRGFRTSQPTLSAAQLAEAAGAEADMSAALAEFRLSTSRAGMQRSTRRVLRRTSVAEVITSRHGGGRVSLDHAGNASHHGSRTSRDVLVIDAPTSSARGTAWFKHLCNNWVCTHNQDFPVIEEGLTDVADWTLVLRGLRVRMGMHSGVPACDIVHNSVSGRTQYTGSALESAKAVCDMAQGAMVLLSASAFRQVTLARVLEDTVVMHLGDFRGNAKDAPRTAQPLYCAIRPALLSRLVALPPLCQELQVSAGTLDAPVGAVSIAFMYMFGYQSIHAWDAQLAVTAANMFGDLLSEKLHAHHGYLVEMDRGFCLAAFASPYDAIQCANSCKEAMLHLRWPESLLEHPLCEEVLDDVNDAMIMRGPRIKVGIDTSTEVLTEISPATGRMTYRGKVMNRAARIASKATSGKVFISDDCWKLCGSDVRDQVDARSQGVMDLKGVGKMEVYCVTYMRHELDIGLGSDGHSNPPSKHCSAQVSDNARRINARRGSMPTMTRLPSLGLQPVATSTVATQTDLTWKQMAIFGEEEGRSQPDVVDERTPGHQLQPAGAVTNEGPPATPPAALVELGEEELVSQPDTLELGPRGQGAAASQPTQPAALDNQLAGQEPASQPAACGANGIPSPLGRAAPAHQPCADIEGVGAPKVATSVCQPATLATPDVAELLPPAGSRPAVRIHLQVK